MEVPTMRKLLVTVSCAVLLAACSAGDAGTPPLADADDSGSSQDAGADGAGPDAVGPDDDGSVYADSVDGASVEPDAAEQDAASFGDPWPASDESFVRGGLLARFWPVTAASSAQLPGTAAVTRIERSVDLTTDLAHIAEMADEGVFTVQLTGGLDVTGTGVWTFVVTAADSVSVTIDGEQILAFWGTGDTSTATAQVPLEAGWHSLEVVYARDPFRTFLQMFAGVDDEPIQLLESEQLGYPESAPEDLTDVGLAVEDELVCDRTALVHTHTASPSIVQATFTSGSSEIVVETDWYVTETTLNADLGDGKTWDAEIVATDAWGRQSTESFEVEVAALPGWETGGIMGTYHSNKQLTAPVATRYDPSISFPDAIDGDVNGNFGINIPTNNFSIEWLGAIWIDEPGVYTFHWGTDDGQRLYMDCALVAENWVNHATSYVDATLQLSEGWHRLQLQMYENGGASTAHFEWTPPGGVRELVPPEFLGTALPELKPGKPALGDIDVTTNVNEPSATVSFSANELVTASVEVIYDETTFEHEFPHLATGFSHTFHYVEFGNAEVKVTVTDRDGETGTSNTFFVLETP